MDHECRYFIFRYIFLISLFSMIIKSVTAGNDSQSNIINTLPGYTGTLPFKLEAGYIGVREDQVQFFYYFIESERDPVRDPLILWFTGGPGCSGLSALLYQIGPLAFNLAAFDGIFPSLVLNPYSWTKMASIIFIDSPVGTGFSYATTPQGVASSDTKASRDNYTFLRKWLMNHPKFIKNPFYVAGDSYGGKIVPMVTLEIAKGNEAGLQPQVMLKGYMVGNPITNENNDANGRIPYAHRMGLVSDEYFEEAKSSCHGEYVSPDPNNFQCLDALKLVNECVKLINIEHILEPYCDIVSLGSEDITLAPIFRDDFLVLSKQDEPWCRKRNHAVCQIWANNQIVRETLHIRKGTITEWKRCTRPLESYVLDVQGVEDYHQLLNNRGYQALVYSGDHDMSVPYVSTLKWIRELNVTVDSSWRPWMVDGQVAGYTEKYRNNQAYITFATVKGAGHVAPEYKPKQCFAMVNRWLSEFCL